MRTAARETAFQIALRNCSREAGEEDQYICDLGEGGNTCNQAHIFTEGLVRVTASHKE